MFDESKFKEFLEKKTEKQKIIVVYGPTACGKTDLAIKIAKSINSEIISTDSRQIFKYLDIGTGKVTENEKQGIIHHMIDIIEPDREYSVGEFKVEAEKILENIFKKGKIPILCGGTGLYIDSLIYDFKIPKVPADARIRQDLEFEREKYGNEFIWKKLQELDPEYASELHPNNYRYVIRALEVKMLTGKSKTDFREEKTLKYEIFFVTPYDGNRAKLYEKIDKRIKIMFETGLLEEVQDLLKKYNKNDFGMKTIGYKEIVDFLEGNMTLDECIALVQKNNRNYAKRQLTWFRRYEKN
ncbi:tRNA (adenosine(37)-N6)-dimethylallyltransferase MiaA [Candidatus Gracilibacteria bacterium HOT-871]|nr:tRNA (adenosine(37)-N6)-dimethylallyltransferase MiaA [Candidatus Gracilibacteria bacterium HOT-871]MBF0913562.1 tRNA (adenosine(37)-N6)-dimethylallyltransferase MiaA [Candidatus Gracilibacteria bacterium]